MDWFGIFVVLITILGVYWYTRKRVPIANVDLERLLSAPKALERKEGASSPGYYHLRICYRYGRVTYTRNERMEGTEEWLCVEMPERITLTAHYYGFTSWRFDEFYSDADINVLHLQKILVLARGEEQRSESIGVAA